MPYDMATHPAKALLLKKALSPKPETCPGLMSHPCPLTPCLSWDILGCPFPFVTLSEIPHQHWVCKRWESTRKEPAATGQVGEQGRITPTCPMGTIPLTLPHLAAIKANPGLLAIGEHLPQCDPKHPGVTGMGESPCLQALRGTPGKKQGSKGRLLWDLSLLPL